MKIEESLWITSLFDRYLGGLANTVLQAVGYPVKDPAHPWSDWFVCEIIVVLLLMALFGLARARLSVDKPGKLQHTLEVLYEFLRAQTEDAATHDGLKFLPYFGTLFFFILAMNLIGLVPAFTSPTMNPSVPLACALSTVVLYHVAGIGANGVGYIKQFTGPLLFLIPLMLPIEIASHAARPMSLTIRLSANMFAGEEVTDAFLGIVPILLPVVFMALHVFVSLVQAFVFTLLSMVYVGGAVAHEH